jgi:hypothetical protein
MSLLGRNETSIGSLPNKTSQQMLQYITYIKYLHGTQPIAELQGTEGADFWQGQYSVNKKDWTKRLRYKNLYISTFYPKLQNCTNHYDRD